MTVLAAMVVGREPDLLDVFYCRVNMTEENKWTKRFMFLKKR